MLLFRHPVLIAAAVLPAIILLLRIRQADRLEPEPPGLLLSLVVRGILATFLALLAERAGSFVLGILFPRSGLAYRLLLCFVVVGGAEEGAKYLLLKRRTWDSPSFDCQFDGVVYAAFVALGFALWENIGYVLMYGLRTALLRAVTAVPGHACFGVFMGAFYGLARRYENLGEAAQSRRCRRWAFVLPALLHGCYDSIAMSRNGALSWIFVAFVLGVFAVAFTLVKRLADRDRYI